MKIVLRNFRTRSTYSKMLELKDLTFCSLRAIELTLRDKMDRAVSVGERQTLEFYF